MKDIHDVITQAKLGDDRLRGSGVVAGQISAFPIDFAGRPYNTLTLPCERVILCLTWTVNANSLKQNIIVIKEVCSSYSCHLGWMNKWRFCLQKGGSQEHISFP